MIGKTIGQYQVIDKIGEGGMGTVYKAEDTTLHRLVALKTLSSHLTEDEEARERFIREAQSASSLNHPNITTVFEFIEEDDTRLICMEYVEGKTIRDMVESGVVSVRKAIDIIMQAAEALDAAHNKGILHRDVKSANIMVNMEGRVKVMDFGLAHLESRSQLTRTGTTMGTLSYSSPEQISGKPVDRRSEIFSLGVVFYELLTGQLPFKASNEAEILFAIINNEPPKLSKVRDDVPELVEAVIERMLEKDTDLRYQTCGDVIGDLKGIRKEMETSTVGITGVLERVKAGRRRSLITQLAIGITVVAVLVVSALLLFPRRVELDPNRVVVALFENQTGDQSLDCGWATISIRDAIDRARLVEVIGHDMVLEYSQIMETRISEQRVESKFHELADFTKAGTLIAGSLFAPNETELELRIAIYDMQTGQSRSLDPIQGSRQSFTNIVGQAQQRVLAALAAQLHPDFGQWTDITNPPSSPEAFREFTLGVQSFFTQHNREALDHLYRSISLDSTFYNAYLWAARVNVTLGIRDYGASDSLLQIIEKYRDNLLPLELHLLNASSSYLQGDKQSEYEAYKQGAKLSPGGFWSYNAGQSAWATNRPEEALIFLEEIHPQSPIHGWYGYYLNMLRTLVALERFDETIDLSRRLQQQFPENSMGYTYEAGSLAILSRLDELESLITKCIDIYPITGVSPTLVIRSVIGKFYQNSQYEHIVKFADMSIQWLKNRPDAEKTDETYRSNLASSYYEGRYWEEAESLYLKLALEYPENGSYIFRLGVLAARRNDKTRSGECSAQLTEIDLEFFDRVKLPLWQACIAAQNGENEQAIMLLKDAILNKGASYEGVKFNIDLEPLYDLPAFKELMKPKG